MSKYPVETRKLSLVIDERNLDTIDLIKLDVEGAETEIIHDIRNHLHSINTIILEFHTSKLPSKRIENTFQILINTGEVRDIKGDFVDLETLMNEKKTLVWHSHSDTGESDEG